VTPLHTPINVVATIGYLISVPDGKLIVEAVVPIHGGTRSASHRLPMREEKCRRDPTSILLVVEPGLKAVARVRATA
jgi:hypothetical protein